MLDTLIVDSDTGVIYLPTDNWAAVDLPGTVVYPHHIIADALAYHALAKCEN